MKNPTKHSVKIHEGTTIGNLEVLGFDLNTGEINHVPTGTPEFSMTSNESEKGSWTLKSEFLKKFDPTHLPPFEL